MAKNIRYMHVDRQLTIYGYIRELEELLSISIPSGLILIFVAFYGNGQRFNPKYVSDSQQLDEDNQIVSHIQNRTLGSAYCEPIMEAKAIEYKWIFEISKDSGNGNRNIGICKVKPNIDPPINNSWYISHGGYALDLRYKRLWHCINGKPHRKGNMKIPPCKMGDIIAMTVDLRLKKIELYNKWWETHYEQLTQDIEFASYIASVGMNCAGNEFKLMSE